MRTPPAAVEVHRLSDAGSWREQLLEDARAGLCADPKTMPPTYFYDARGAELFEEITRLPEYYQTRAETALLEDYADELVAEVRPTTVVELGSGASRKTRVLLEAARRAGAGHRFVGLDVSEDMLRTASAQLATDYPWLEVTAVVGDFHADLGPFLGDGAALVAFLGSTIGNLHPDRQEAFLSRLVAGSRPGDGVLIGFDLVKDHATLQRAYDDEAGVTAEFNRNMLQVLNRELGADFPVEEFEHVARYDARNRWVEMALRAPRALTVTLEALDLRVGFAAGEELRTEISCKFRREDVEALYQAAGLVVRRWVTDPGERFALALGKSLM